MEDNTFKVLSVRDVMVIFGRMDNGYFCSIPGYSAATMLKGLTDTKSNAGILKDVLGDEEIANLIASELKKNAENHNPDGMGQKEIARKINSYDTDFIICVR